MGSRCGWRWIVEGICEGYHLKLADGPFEFLMNELGIKPPKEVENLPDDLGLDWFKKLLDDMGKGRKGKSTLKKWCCPECGHKVRIGVSDDPLLRHQTFENPDCRPIFLVSGNVYVPKKNIYTHVIRNLLDTTLCPLNILELKKLGQTFAIV